jgi:hypothetical protein
VVVTGSQSRTVKFWAIQERVRILNKKKQIWLEGAVFKTLAGCDAAHIRLLPSCDYLLSLSKKYVVQWHL